jgi:predicted deacylase
MATQTTTRVFEIDGVRAAPGEVSKGYLDVAKRLDGTSYVIPIMIINGMRDGPRVCISAGVHGNEYPGPLAIATVIPSLDPKTLRGTVVALPVVHMAAFERKRRENEIDCVDLNRNAPGGLTSRYAHKVANKVFHDVLPKTEYFLDLHNSGDRIDVLPMSVTEPGFEELSLGFAKALGHDIIWQGLHAEGVWIREALKLGLKCASVEIGDPEYQKKTILNTLKWLKMIDGNPDWPKQWRVVEGRPTYARDGGLWVPEVKIRDEVKQGQVIGRLINLFGEVVDTVKAEYAGIVCSLRHYAATNPGNEVVGYYKTVKVLN